MSQFSSNFLSAYVSAFSAAADDGDSDQMSSLLKLDAEVVPGGWDFVESVKACSVNRFSNFDIRPPFDEIAELHLRTLHYCMHRNYEAAVKAQISKFNKFLEVYKVEGSWLTYPMYTLIADTRMLAMLADKNASKSENEYLVEAKRLFDSCFRYTIMGRASTEDGLRKRQGALFIIVNQFKVYFKLGTLQLCKNLIRSVNQPNFPDFESFPLSHQVTYKYYVGRIKVLEDDMVEAEKNLSYALRYCNKNYPENIRRILEYLIPVKLILGYLPDKTLLQRPGLSHLNGLIKAVKQGNVRELSAELEKNQGLYISKGLYLSLDRLKILAYRNLFRGVVLIHQQAVKEDSTQKSSAAQRVPIKMFLKPFQRFGEHDVIMEQLQDKDSEKADEEDFEQIKCIVANLIFKGYVKGYISHQHGFLVLSANMPFPPLKNCSIF